MQFTVVVDGVCAGGNHVSMTAISGAITKALSYSKSDFIVDFSNLDEVETAVAVLLRSRVKQKAAALGIGVGQMTNVQIKTAIEEAPYYL